MFKCCFVLICISSLTIQNIILWLIQHLMIKFPRIKCILWGVIYDGEMG